MIDLDRYFSRIQYAGSVSQTHDTLTALVEHHLASIPFENIDVLLDRGIDIAPESIDTKLIDDRRGGYCFEHNGLFARVLEALGFEVERLSARVMWGRNNDDTPRPRTHMALRVHSEGRAWLVDVGFGGVCPVAPLAFDDAAPQPTFLETFRVVPAEDGYIVEAQIGEHWKPMYDLSRVALLDVDYEPLNWFTATHPTSPFKQHLMAALATRDARYSLVDSRLTIRQRDGTQHARTLDADQLSAALVEHFGLEVVPEWRPLIERLTSRG